MEDFRLLLPTLDGKRFFAVDCDGGQDRLGHCPVDFSEPLAASLQEVGPADHIIVAEKIRCAFAKSLRARGGEKNRRWLSKVVAQTEAISHALRELYDRLHDPQLLRLAAASDLVSSDRVGKRNDDPNGRSRSKSVRAELRRARLEGHIDHEVALFRCIAPFVEASSHPYLDLQEAERYLLSACCLYGVLAQRPVWRSHLASHVQPATTNLLQKANDLIGRAEKAAADFPDKESVGRARNLSIIAKAVADALGSHEGQRTQDRSRRLAELVVHAATGSPYELPSGPLAFHQEVKKVLDVKPPVSLDSRRLHASIALSVFAAEASLADPGQHSWVAVAKDIDSALTSLAKEELQRLPPASTTFLVIDAIRALDASFGLDAREKGNRIAALRGRAEMMLGGQGRTHIERVAARLEHYNIMRSTFPEVHTISRFMHLRRRQGAQPLPQRFDVFVSYSTADAGIAREVVDRLRERGLRVWVDFDGGRALESGTKRVADALLRCECVVVIASETSRDRAFAQAEQGLRKEGPTVRLCVSGDGAACKPGDIVFSSSDNAWFKKLLTKIRGQD